MNESSSKSCQEVSCSSILLYFDLLQDFLYFSFIRKVSEGRKIYVDQPFSQPRDVDFINYLMTSDSELDSTRSYFGFHKFFSLRSKLSNSFSCFCSFQNFFGSHEMEKYSSRFLVQYQLLSFFQFYNISLRSRNNFSANTFKLKCQTSLPRSYWHTEYTFSTIQLFLRSFPLFP